MLKNLLKLLLIFIFGIFGGIFGSQILWPLIVEKTLFFGYKLEQQPIYITQNITKEIKIQENVALQNAIEKVEKSIVGIQTKTKKGKVLQGSGLILTTDGLILTLADLISDASTTSVYLENEILPAQILKKDTKTNLALLKVEKERTPTVSFGDFEKIKLGQRVFLMGISFSEKEKRKVVNEGILKYFDQNILETNIQENENLLGSSLFDIDGNFLGLNFLNKEEKISSIPTPKIKTFVGF